MTSYQFAQLMDLLGQIKTILQVSDTLNTGICLLMFGIGWSSAGR